MEVLKTLPKATFRLLRKFAKRRSPMRMERLARVVGGEIGVVDLAPMRPRLTHKRGERPAVTLNFDFGTPRIFEFTSAARNKSVSLRLEDGSHLMADHASMDFVGLDGLRCSLYNWRWSAEAGTPVVWFGTADIDINIASNMRVMTRRGVEHGCFHVQGHHDWYILPAKFGCRRHPVAVLSRDGDIDHSTLWRDLFCLSFTMGAFISLPVLYGTDENMKMVSAIELASRPRKSRNRHTPVYEKYSFAGEWHAEFFTLLAAKVAEPDGYQLYVRGFSNYLDSLETHFDAAYVLLQVGLEALIKNVATSEDMASMVTDPVAYCEWTKTVPDQGRAHFVERSDAASLKGMLWYAAFPSPVRILKRMAARHGIKLPKDLIEEVRTRNKAVHDFLTVPDLEYVVDDIDRRQNMIRTLIAAVTAMAIGYDGPLVGYDVAPDGDRLPPAWWTKRKESRRTAADLPRYTLTSR